MTLITRSQLHAAAVPTSAPTAPLQPGSFSQLLAYSARALEAHTPRGQSVKLLLSNGATQDYQTISIGSGLTTGGEQVIVVSAVVQLNPAVFTGPGVEWAYATPWPGMAVLNSAYSV